MKNYTILLVTDDGYRSKNFKFLKSWLKEQGHTVYSVAPDANCSAISAAVTSANSPYITFTEISKTDLKVFSTPVDCVHFAIAFFKEVKFDLCISGINFGENTGIHALHSGTVMAALTASSYGIPSIAVSSEDTEESIVNHKDQDRALQILSTLIEHGRLPILDRGALYALTLNYNIPSEIKGNPVLCSTSPNHYSMSFEPSNKKGPIKTVKITSSLSQAPYGDAYFLKQGIPTVTVLSPKFQANYSSEHQQIPELLNILTQLEYARKL